MAQCLFCRIARKELDSEIVSETDKVVAFRDINPAAPTHVLVVPKEHIGSAQELTRAQASVLTEIFEAMNAIAEKEGLSRGFRVVTNVGPDAGQSVQHLHFHLIGGRPLAWPPG